MNRESKFRLRLRLSLSNSHTGGEVEEGGYMEGDGGENEEGDRR